jgi:hypothetical protein
VLQLPALAIQARFGAIRLSRLQGRQMVFRQLWPKYRRFRARRPVLGSMGEARSFHFTLELYFLSH